MDLVICIVKICIFLYKKSVLTFKNMFPSLYFCRLFICYVDTHVESHAIKINSVAICSRSKFNLIRLILPRSALLSLPFGNAFWHISQDLQL